MDDLRRAPRQHSRYDALDRDAEKAESSAMAILRRDAERERAAADKLRDTITRLLKERVEWEKLLEAKLGKQMPL